MTPTIFCLEPHSQNSQLNQLHLLVNNIIEEDKDFLIGDHPFKGTSNTLFLIEKNGFKCGFILHEDKQDVLECLDHLILNETGVIFIISSNHKEVNKSISSIANSYNFHRFENIFTLEIFCESLIKYEVEKVRSLIQLYAEDFESSITNNISEVEANNGSKFIDCSPMESKLLSNSLSWF